MEIILLPLELLLQVIFEFSYTLTHNYGVSLILLSIIVSTILLPLYALADKWKESETAHQHSMKQDLDTIKKHYAGQEKYYAIRACHRIYHYHPLMSLKVSLGFLIQIPFFLAAYHLLSHYTAYQGVSFLGIINDLSMPDSLLGNINILPILMTVCNLVAAIVYASSAKNKDDELKNFIQLLLLSLFFMIVLYNAPSGLLIYWTTNNIYALIKYWVKYRPSTARIISTAWEVYAHIMHHKYTGFTMLVLLGIIFNHIFIYSSHDFRNAQIAVFSIQSAGLLFYPVLAYMIYYAIQTHSKMYKFSCYAGIFFFLLSIVVGIALEIVLFFHIGEIESNFNSALLSITPNRMRQLLIATELMSFLALVPAFLQKWFLIKNITTFIEKEAHAIHSQSKKQKYTYSTILLLFISSIYLFHIPLHIYLSEPKKITNNMATVLQTLGLIALGVFILGSIVFSLLQKFPKLYYMLSATLYAILIQATFYAFFLPLRTGGLIDDRFAHDTFLLQLEPLLFVMESGFIILVLYLTILHFKKITRIWTLAMSIIIAFGVFDAGKTLYTQRVTLDKNNTLDDNLLPSYNEKFVSFSKEKNILLIVFDGFPGDLLPYILDTYPHITEILDGFTWYKNTVSMYPNTVSSLPSIIGGEKLRTQMSEENYHNTILAGYEMWANTLDDYNLFFKNPTAGIDGSFENIISDINARLKNAYAANQNLDYFPYWKTHGLGVGGHEETSSFENTDYFLYRPLIAFSLFRLAPVQYKRKLYQDKNWETFLHSKKPTRHYLYVQERYLSDNIVMDVLPHISNTNSKKKTLKILWDESTHSPFYLNAQCRFEHQEILNNSHNFYSTENHINTLRCTLERLGTWFDWMKEQGIYDSTKIVITSDHGAFHTRKTDNQENQYYVIDAHGKNIYMDEKYINNRRTFAVLMVKDFNQRGNIKIDYQLMANTDASSIMASGIPEHDFPMLIKDPITWTEPEKNNRQLTVRSNNGTVTIKDKELAWITEI